MYLPQLKEGVDRLAKNPKVCIVIALVLAILVFAGGWLLCRHYDNIERADSHDVTQTVRDIKDINRDAQEQLDKARDANQRAATANQNAQGAADSISNSNRELSDLNQSDQRAIDAAEQVFTEIERRDK